MIRSTLWALSLTLFLTGAFVHAQCVNDHRSNKNAGILISDFTITGTQSTGADQIARITGDMIGSCFDEDSDEMGERVRASFQDRGYFKVEVKSVHLKPRDPLGVPKPVTMEVEVSEGPQYRLGDVTFVNNHAFPPGELRQQFPLKRGDLVARGKIVAGLDSLRKLYGTRGFLDWVAIPNVEFGSNATLNLSITIEEGPQYHMGKLEILGAKESSGRLRAAWKLAEGDVFDNTYIDKFLDANRDLLPSSFNRANVETASNCPEALAEVRLVIDPLQEAGQAQPKSVPCEEHHDELERRDESPK